MRISQLALSIIVLLTSCWHQGRADEKYALLVGVSKYGHSRMNDTQLQYPEADASAVANVLKTSGYAVKTLLGNDATRKAVTSSLQELHSQGSADGVVVVGLFGHGVQYGKDAYFAPYDTSIRIVKDADGRTLRDGNGQPKLEPNPDSMVSMRSILDALAVCRASNRVLLADCCREDPSQARGRAFGSQLKLSDLPRGTAALFACSENERAFEHKDWGHGAFTSALLKHCRMAESDLTVNGLSATVYKEVRRQVRDKTNGTETQTVNPIINGIVELKLTSPTKAVAELLGTEFVRIRGGEYEHFGEKKKISDMEVTRSRVTVNQFAKFVKATQYKTVCELAKTRDVLALRKRGYTVVSEDRTLNEGEIPAYFLEGNWRDNDGDSEVVNLTGPDIEAFVRWVVRETSVKVRLANFAELPYLVRAHNGALSNTSGGELCADSESHYCITSWPPDPSAGCYQSLTPAMKEGFRLILPIE